MTLRDGILTDWRWQAGFVVFLSVILGVVAGRHSNFHMIEVIVGVNAIAGLVAVVYQLSSSNEQPHIGNVQREEQQEPDTIDTETHSEDENERSRTGASDGLTAEEQAVQNEMIRRDYRDFYENPVANFVHRQPSVNGLSENWEEDTEIVRKVWRMSTDDGFYDRKKNSWELSPKAVQRAEELGEDILLDEDIQDDILELLLESYRDGPMRPLVSRDTLIDALDCSENEIDHNIWLLKKKRYVETEAYMGDSRGYSEVKITDLGRRVVE